MNKGLITLAFLFLAPSLCLAKKTLVELETDRLQIETKKALIFSRINLVESNIQSLTDGLATRKNKLTDRLQSSQLLKNNKWGSLLALKNITLLQRNLNTLRAINQHDLNFIHEQIYKLDELKHEKLKLIQMNSEFESLTEKLKNQENLISLEESEENQILLKDAKSSLLLLKGNLARPIRTVIKESYGLIKQKKMDMESKEIFGIESQYMLYHKGYTFAGTDDKGNKFPVQAIGPGTVIFRDVLNHWGESIILQHDGGYFSIYANVKNCAVQLEHKVQMSEKICESTSDDLYFELRHFKVTINPKNWIKDFE